MKNSMSRDEVLSLLAHHKLQRLSHDERAEILLNYWIADDEDEDYTSLPTDLQEQMATADVPGDPENPKYDPLLIRALRHQYIGVTNAYLIQQLRNVEYTNVTIVGEPECLSVCPCCGFLTLREHGAYEICPVCFWEDNGSNDPTKYSHPNRKTLGEARENFKRFGAEDERSLPFVDKELGKYHHISDISDKELSDI